MRIVMLTPTMKMGFGVSEAVAMQVRYLRPLGIDAAVGCLDKDGSFSDIFVARIGRDRTSVFDFATGARATAVIAHGSPFFEVLPSLADDFRTIAYEYGDPTPEMFVGDAAERRSIADNKKVRVYPHVDSVAVISEFIRHDIDWPDAHVIRLGIEHIEDLGPKPWLPPADSSRPLRIGTLMRLGAGEAQYKGPHLLPVLRDLVRTRAPGAVFEVMGRGTQDAAADLRSAGFTVHLNATDEQRAAFLRDIDVFVSPSLWEGMNLPVVEAQALGTPGLAFDTGAHPEFTPLVFTSPQELALQIGAYDRDRGLLADHGRTGYEFVRHHLSWQRTAYQIAALLAGRHPEPPRRRPAAYRHLSRIRRLRYGLAQAGVRETARYYANKARRLRSGKVTG